MFVVVFFGKGNIKNAVDAVSIWAKKYSDSQKKPTFEAE
jgi:hypothetical protein